MAKALSFEEYLTYEDGTDTRYELVEGKLVPIEIGTWLNTLLIDFLSSQLKNCLSNLALTHLAFSGSIGIQTPRGTGTNTSRIPDITVLAIEQIKQMLDRPAVIRIDEPPPFLVVEVVGLSTKTTDYRAKWPEYSVLNIPEYWIVDPLSDLITICTLEDGMYTSHAFKGSQQLQSPLLPNFTLTAAQVLAAGLS